ncbi:MAG TPA: hypothetical protein VGP47_02645, partial [Parachlamydiaceae bacterium]|nr:hypothetical protein [Parachlamydiaceae bacterium]
MRPTAPTFLYIEQKEEGTVYDRICVGIDIGTSHCQVVAFGKSYDPEDEEKYVYTKKPISSERGRKGVRKGVRPDIRTFGL